MPAVPSREAPRPEPRPAGSDVLVDVLPAPDPSSAPTALPRQVLVFLVVGGLTTAGYAGLVAALAPLVGLQAANALAVALTAVVNTGGNRRWGFGVRGRDEALRHQAQGLVSLLVPLALTSAVIALSGTDEATPAGLAVLVAANAVAGVLHFLLLARWVFVRRA